jgi:uncharacterized protein YcbK (DUF882 family)
LLGIMRIDARVVWALAIAGGILSGCATSTQKSEYHSNGGPDRRIALYNTDTGERVETAYRTNGAYDPAGLTVISNLLRDRRSGEVQPIDPTLLDLMSDILAKLDLPESTEIYVNSGYRSPSSNAILAKTNPYVADDSYHLRGQAADIRIPGVSLVRVAQAAAELHGGGYALYASHVHVDTGPYRTWGRSLDGATDVMVASARPRPMAKKPVQLAVAKPGKPPHNASALKKPGNPKAGEVQLARLPAVKPGIILAKAELPARPVAKSAGLKRPALKPATP